MKEPEIITTSDGSHSLLNTILNETYHSVHGAIQESRHVFIKSGLEYFLQTKGTKRIAVLEIGFGTGLNALMTLQSALQSDCEIHYTALEPFPLDLTLIQTLNYPKALNFPKAELYFSNLHTVSWEMEHSIAGGFSIYKRKARVQNIDFSPSSFDLVYFDAFAPAKQPEMWELSVLEKIEQAMKSQAVFVTYCAKGQLKRDLKSLDFVVETLSGPPGKKEMVRATKK